MRRRSVLTRQVSSSKAANADFHLVISSSERDRERRQKGALLSFDSAPPPTLRDSPAAASRNATVRITGAVAVLIRNRLTIASTTGCRRVCTRDTA